jgi:cytosine/uracil/thiamine/allantoin permease
MSCSGFPILNRASFGVFGAWWPTFNRAVMAIVWNGVNAVQGGQCVYVMLHALTPHIASIKNVMGSGSALDSGGMIGFAIFWILTCCFLIIPVPKVIHLWSIIQNEQLITELDERTCLRQADCLYYLSHRNVRLDTYKSWRHW